MDTIEQNHLLEDDEDQNAFLYRKDMLQFSNQDEVQETGQRRAKKMAQKNKHLQHLFDFTTELN